MGTLLRSTLFQPPIESVDDAVEIGATPLRIPATAMRIVQNTNDAKELIYIEELPINLASVPADIDI